jgi:UDP-N-acetylglucosamine--N-acetylmuramyl-(pentapeptide) pyrophosphoryl-undecaprenol N-acetylglucosamine transferase
VTFAIAAAGTGGHVFPGLAVGEALVAFGVSRDDILYLGGDRLESEIYPAAGFPFLRTELRGLERRLATANFGIPLVVMRATRDIAAEFRKRGVSVVLGMGSYVSVPAGLAARKLRTRLVVHEQNAEAGLANRVIAPMAWRVFGSFPQTARLPTAEWVGNPIRAGLAAFDRDRLRPDALRRYGLEQNRGVVGIVGGSLGAGLLNEAAEDVAKIAAAYDFALLHLTGAAHFESIHKRSQSIANWRALGFERDMEFFYAACDLVVARAGGAVAELTATNTPSILVPGGFGSGRHQAANAEALSRGGAAVVVQEAEISRLPLLVGSLLSHREHLEDLSRGSKTLSRPDAASVIASALIASAEGSAHG